MGTVRETLAESTEGTLQYGSKRPRVYSDLTSEEKDQYNADIWATNILLQGLPKDIYTLINHYDDAKDIWDNVKMLLEGSELTKEDQDSQLDKIGSKPDKNGKPGEAEKSQKQLQSREQEKLKKMQVEGPKMQTPTKFY
nr:integrase, catalytic region, zinc finger, CCHC-type, peptidase aspartic, catalytic [Tanacetum cinerariifolium]